MSAPLLKLMAASQSGAGLLVKSLEAQGVKYIFGIPGAKIVNSVRSDTLTQAVQHPGIPDFEWTGDAHGIASVAQAKAKLIALHPQAKVVCSAAPEITGTRRIENVSNPHELADVDVGVVRAQFGVAESGAVWLTQGDLGIDALAFLSQHLIVLLDPEQIVPYMHEAYARARLDATA